MKIIVFLAIIFNFYTAVYNDEDLKGIPKGFDSEYNRESDYPYFSLDKVLSTFYDESKFGRKISTIGYISRDTTFPKNDGIILLQRIFVTCCISHANPVTIYLETENPDLFQDEIWVKVNGTVVGVKNELGTSPCIKAEKIEIIPKPENPYLNCDACPAEH